MRQYVQPAGTRADPAAPAPPASMDAPGADSGWPRVLRIPADWWDSASSIGCPLNREPRAARAARQLTRNTLRGWGLMSLAGDAEIIVGELVANAVIHAASPARAEDAPTQAVLSLRLIHRATEVICAVLDPSEAPPAPEPFGTEKEAGRGLQLVGALSDVWGWSPVAGRGKAVWAVLFCT